MRDERKGVKESSFLWDPCIFSLGETRCECELWARQLRQAVIKHYLPALRLEKELSAQVRQCDKDQSGITVTLQRQTHLQCLSENPVNLFLPVNLQQSSASRCFTATH